MIETPSGFIEVSKPVHNYSIPPGCNINVSVPAVENLSTAFASRGEGSSAPSKQRGLQV